MEQSDLISICESNLPVHIKYWLLTSENSPWNTVGKPTNDDIQWAINQAKQVVAS